MAQSLHVHDDNGTSVSIFYSPAPPFRSLHFVITLAGEGRAYAGSLLDSTAPSLLAAAISTGAVPVDPKLQPALLRVLGKGALPLRKLGVAGGTPSAVDVDAARGKIEPAAALALFAVGVGDDAVVGACILGGGTLDLKNRGHRTGDQSSIATPLIAHR